MSNGLVVTSSGEGRAHEKKGMLWKSSYSSSVFINNIDSDGLMDLSGVLKTNIMYYYPNNDQAYSSEKSFSTYRHIIPLARVSAGEIFRTKDGININLRCNNNMDCIESGGIKMSEINLVPIFNDGLADELRDLINKI